MSDEESFNDLLSTLLLYSKQLQEHEISLEEFVIFTNKNYLKLFGKLATAWTLHEKKLNKLDSSDKS